MADKGKRNSKNEPDNPVLASTIPVEFKISAYPKNEAPGVLIAARQLPGYQIACGILGQALSSRVDKVLMDFAAQGGVVRFRVDGLWEVMPALDRPSADAALEVIKKVCGMNPKERRLKQTGKVGAQVTGTDWLIESMSQGVPTGERVLLTIEPKKGVLKTLTDLGMREKMQESLKAYLNGHEGIVIISGPPGHGLPTTWRIALESADKFVRDYVSLEDKDDPDPEIINITKNLVDVAGGQNIELALEKALLKQPDCVVLPRLYNEAVFKLILLELMTHKKHTIMRIPATDAAEAFITLLNTYKNQAKDILRHTQCVLNQRLVRRLCEKCRVPFVPTPQLLQKLGIPAGRVRQLFQPFIPPPPEQRVDAKGNPIEIPICPQCKGRGYFGRMAIFELLEINDNLRKVLQKQPKVEALRAAAIEEGHRSFNEEGIVAVALGLTSLQEIQKMIQGK